MVADQEGPSIEASLIWAQRFLTEAQIEGGRRDARLLLAEALGHGLEFIIAHPEHHLSVNEFTEFSEFVQRRSLHEPVSRILGHREFWSLPFRISPATLDPRPDSEGVIESVLNHFADRNQPLRILDLGTGSGCLLITLLKEYINAYGVGVDLSFDALKVASENAQSLDVKDRTGFINGSWGDALGTKFDIIISNPPYIPSKEIHHLAPEVALFDPSGALDGGEDGLECYRQLAPQIKRLLALRGITVVEIGQGQDVQVEKIFANSGLLLNAWHKDLAGIKRCGSFYQDLDKLPE